MMEFLQCLELVSHLKKLIPSASNFLIIAYALTCLHNPKATIYLVAFLCVELFTYTSLTDGIEPVMFWLIIGATYCFLYWYSVKNNYELKVLLSCVIIMILDSGMALDAQIYPTTETYIYANHIWFALFVHVNCINAFIRWRIIRSSVGKSLDCVVRVLGNNYNITFLLYNISNSIKKQN